MYKKAFTVQEISQIIQDADASYRLVQKQLNLPETGLRNIEKSTLKEFLSEPRTFEEVLVETQMVIYRPILMMGSIYDILSALGQKQSKGEVLS